MPKFKKKLECNQFCEANCPKPYDSKAAAQWVANTMQSFADLGYYRGYDWTRDWGIAHQINYDMAFVM